MHDDQLFDKPILVAGQGICRQRHTISAGLLADLGLTGPIAAALMEHAETLLAVAPEIMPAEVLAEKVTT